MIFLCSVFMCIQSLSLTLARESNRVKPPIPDQDPIGNLHGVMILIRLVQFLVISFHGWLK